MATKNNITVQCELSAREKRSLRHLAEMECARVARLQWNTFISNVYVCKRSRAYVADSVLFSVRSLFTKLTRRHSWFPASVSSRLHLLLRFIIGRANARNVLWIFLSFAGLCLRARVVCLHHHHHRARSHRSASSSATLSLSLRVRREKSALQ